MLPRRLPLSSLLATALLAAATLLSPSPAAADPTTCTNAAADLTCDVNEPCTCDDCFTAPKCGGCVDNGTCASEEDACTCADCAADPFCSDLANCEDNGKCSQFTEGCQCSDCAGKVPNCGAVATGGSGGTGTGGSGTGGSGGASTSGSGGSSTGGSGGSGGLVSTPSSGCGCEVASPASSPTGLLALAALGVGLGWRRRRR